jgi:DNA-binding PadR family transcriptional regulator
MRALDPVILGFLRYGAASGYDIKRSVDRSVGHFWTVSYGGLYPALARLREEGLVVLRAEEGRRKVYEITPRGLAAFEEWWRAPYPAPVVKDGFLLRLFFSTPDELEALAPQLRRRVVELTETEVALKRVERDLEAGALRLAGPGQRTALEIGLGWIGIEIRQVEALLAGIEARERAERAGHES